MRRSKVFERGIRGPDPAQEDWRAEKRVSTIRAEARGVFGGVVAVIVKVMGDSVVENQINDAEVALKVSSDCRS